MLTQRESRSDIKYYHVLSSCCASPYSTFGLRNVRIDRNKQVRFPSDYRLLGNPGLTAVHYYELVLPFSCAILNPSFHFQSLVVTFLGPPFHFEYLIFNPLLCYLNSSFFQFEFLNVPFLSSFTLFPSLCYLELSLFYILNLYYVI